jgi:hypothetical protein
MKISRALIAVGSLLSFVSLSSANAYAVPASFNQIVEKVSSMGPGVCDCLPDGTLVFVQKDRSGATVQTPIKKFRPGLMKADPRAIIAVLPATGQTRCEDTLMNEPLTQMCGLETTYSP